MSASAGDVAAEVDTPPDAEVPLAPVEIDGDVLFSVRGVSAYPAQKRAAAVKERIEAIAADPSISLDSLRSVESAEDTRIVAGGQLLIKVVDADAKLEDVKRQELAGIFVHRIRGAIEAYRHDRTPDALLQSGLYAMAAAMLLALSLVFIVWLGRGLDALMERRLHRHMQGLGIQSFEIVRAERLWAALRGATSAARALIFLIIVLTGIHGILVQFPWTRFFATRLLDVVVAPLTTMGWAIAVNFPDLAFLAVLIVVVRYVLKLVHFFFDAVARGSVNLVSFQPEWAVPTYKIVRFTIIAFALVVAYPYIPGARSAAFKGISLFLGVVFSLGSSSFIANSIAGYALIYRRAFRLGDRVKIGDMLGDVVEMRVQVTHLRSLKNEEIIVPNSTIMSSTVVNYSSLARKQGLILHTVVGIGYEVPWRQVEAMLLMAAERTPALMHDPGPFILQQSLGDFAVNYELNVHCNDASRMFEFYTELHRNILDVFNEYDVQIMTPAYVGDPLQPKVVPKGQWFAEPAVRD